MKDIQIFYMHIILQEKKRDQFHFTKETFEF